MGPEGLGILTEHYFTQHLRCCRWIFHAAVVADLRTIRTVRPQLINNTAHVTLLCWFFFNNEDVTDSLGHNHLPGRIETLHPTHDLKAKLFDVIEECYIVAV